MTNILEGVFIDYCRENNIRDIDIERVDGVNFKISALYSDPERSININVTPYFANTLMKTFQNIKEIGNKLWNDIIPDYIAYLRLYNCR